MQLLPDNSLLLSAGDLTGSFECRHLTRLDLAYARGDRSLTPVYGADAERLFAKGMEHEKRYLQSLKDEGRGVVEIPEADRQSRESLAAAVRATEQAMQAGAEVVYQAALLHDGLRGYADFLFRVDRPSRLGGWSYEVADAKLSGAPRAYQLLQLCFYSELVHALQGGDPPEHARLILAGVDDPVLIRLAEFSGYFRRLLDRLLAELEADRWETYPLPVKHCEVCRWREACNKRWEDEEHVSLVAGVGATTARDLLRAGIGTVPALASVGTDVTVEGIKGLDKLREQAAIQLKGRRRDSLECDLLPPEPGRGFARLPHPSSGDMFFDIEGYPYWSSDPEEDPYAREKLEYLLGWVTVEAGEPRYEELWALDRDQEKRALERFVDLVYERSARDPEMHIYHYGHYERTQLRHLAWLHQTRRQEFEPLIGEGVFVDLQPVVKEALRISQPSYSLKKVEAFYRPGARDTGGVTDAGDSIIAFERWLESDPRDPAILQELADYNRDDCASTWQLREWLLSLRPEAEREHGAQIEWFERPEPEEQKQPARVPRADVELAAALLAGLPPNPERRASGRERARWLLGQLLEKAPRALSAWSVRVDDAAVQRLEPGREGLRRLAAALAGGEEQECPHEAARQILRGESPRLAGAAAAIELDRWVGPLGELVRALDCSCLVVQGPPRSGKTARAAALVAELAGAGLSVAVAAPTEVEARAMLTELRGPAPGAVGEEEDAQAGRRSNGRPLDVLVIDDAERVSLADALVLATSASSVVLIGDPQRWPDKPDPRTAGAIGLSVLRHLFSERRTVAPERGVLLAEAPGLQPEVAGLLSEVMYDGRVQPPDRRRTPRVDAEGPLAGSGLRWLAVEHEGNSNESPEEADAIAYAASALLDGGRYVDPDGAARALRPEDIIALTAHEAQACRLKDRLLGGVRVGNVKGTEREPAAVVFFSLATGAQHKPPAYADRLLNAAISRADCLAVLVLDPRVLDTRADAIAQMRALNALCRLVELAGRAAGPTAA